MPDARFHDSQHAGFGASPVLHLKHTLSEEPATPGCDGVALRCYEGGSDLAAWLALRDRAFADQQPAVGKWIAADFEREFLNQSWWRPERMWLALNARDEGRRLVGSVTLAVREIAGRPRAAIHWLMVDPAHRRRGIGRLLMSAAESATWREGFREVQLESHAGWTAALGLYRATGYLPIRTMKRNQEGTTAAVADGRE